VELITNFFGIFFTNWPGLFRRLRGEKAALRADSNPEPLAKKRDQSSATG
jgi:hypothetical protein